MSAPGLILDDTAWGSPWRHRAVRDKTFLSVGLVVAALLLPPWPGTVLVGLTAVAILLGPAGVAPRLLARSLWLPTTFILTGALSVLVSVSWDGHPVVAITPATATTAATLLAHGWAGTAALFVLGCTTPMVDILAGLRRMRVPDAAVEIASLTYRLLFVLLGTARAIHEAQTARLGYTTYRRWLSSLAVLAGSLFVRSWERARRMEEGLAGRGYVDALRTLDPPRRASAAFVAASAALLGAITAVSLLVGR